MVAVRESQPPPKDDHNQTLDGQKSKANNEAASPKSSNFGLGMNYNTKPTAQVAPTGSTKRYQKCYFYYLLSFYRSLSKTNLGADRDCQNWPLRGLLLWTRRNNTYYGVLVPRHGFELERIHKRFFTMQSSKASAEAQKMR